MFRTVLRDVVLLRTVLRDVVLFRTVLRDVVLTGLRDQDSAERRFVDGAERRCVVEDNPERRVV